MKNGKKKLSFKVVLAIMVIPLIACMIGLMVFMAVEVNGTYHDSEELFYGSLYQINTRLINGDRDFYQASLAVTEYQIMKAGGGDQTKLEESLSDYSENAQQVMDNVGEAMELAKKNADLYTGTLSENGNSFEKLAGEFVEAYNTWKSAYDPKTGSGDFEKQTTLFFAAREYLSEMSDVAETWAEKEDANMNKSISVKVKTVSIVASVIIVALIVICIILLINMLKAFKQIASSISILANGDFVTPIVNNSFIKEFSEIADTTEEMRDKLQESLITVTALANNVEEGAATTESRIEDSQRMSEDISHAVDDLANGATSMANDVQSTSSLTIHIGDSVNSVFGSTTTNNDNSKQVYDNAGNVKKQLEALKKAGMLTDEMASQVADSVNETAKVVEKISQAAEAIINIASQTNLLALNASIEAARAGESGKGFAVVANSIKDLANESDEAAQEITEMLSQIVSMSDKNKDLTMKIKEATHSEAGELQKMTVSFDEMMKLLRLTEEGNRNILSLVESLNSDKDSVMDSVGSLSAISEENAAATEETSASLSQLATNMEDVVAQAKALKQVSNDLQQSIEYFKVQ